MSWAAGKSILVTGGTQGIGHATALAFRDLGANVTVTGTRAAASAYEGDFAGLSYVKVNMAEKADITALAAGLSTLDVLVNNAGMASENEYDLANFEAVIAVNLNAVMDVCLRCHPLLKVAGGSIVNVGSLASFLALRETPAYNASKAGILGLTRALADKWAPDGIRVNMVAPGFIETRMTAPMRREANYESRMLKAIPMRRWGQPEEVAEPIVFLASPGAAYITGQSLAMDGGLMLR